MTETQLEPVEIPQVLHALLAEESEPMIPGRLYPTLCGTHWEYQQLWKDEQRTRFVCALCHERQIEELRKTLNDLISTYNSHLGSYHYGVG